MAEEYRTTLKWHGSKEIGQRLANLVPQGMDYEFVEDDGRRKKREDTEILSQGIGYYFTSVS